MVAPVIPGINDHEIPAIVAACAKAGAQFAGHVLFAIAVGCCGHCSNIGWRNIFQNEKRKCSSGLAAQVAAASCTIRAGESAKPAKEFSLNRSPTCSRSLVAAPVSQSGPKLSTAAFRRPNEQLKLFVEALVASACLVNSAFENKRRYNFCGFVQMEARL